MNKIAYLIDRFFLHLRQGTFLRRIREERQEYIKSRRRIRWDNHITDRESFIFSLQRNIKINLYFESALCRLIYCDNFEWRERRFLNLYLRPGDIFVDIGANVGLFTLIASRRVGESGKVYAFEPCTKTCQRLAGNVDLNRMKNVQYFQMALSDRSGQVQMNSSLDGYDAWNSLAPPIGGNDFASEMVSAIAWDDFAREHNLIGRVTMMKIDVEGWESHVLDGGMETFSRKDAPILQIEFTDKACQSAGSSCQFLYSQLEKFGYQMFLYDEISNNIIPDPIRNSYPYINLIASKNPDYIISRIGK